MKILIVTWYFPPVNTIGALRTGSLARFLIERGHEIGVVAGKDWGHPETMPLGLPLDRVVYARAANINALPQYLARKLKRSATALPSGDPVPLTLPLRGSLPLPGGERAGVRGPLVANSDIGTVKSLQHRLGDFYTRLTNVPDGLVGWMPGAYRGCLQLCRDWTPDLIFASGPPFTAQLVAHRASRKLGVPWISELRDRWADDPYDPPPPWRLRIDQWLEHRVLGSARGLVTVSEPWAEFYRRKYGKPLAMILNGYNPEDFAFSPGDESGAPPGPLIIGYTGGIYPGKRDPTPLFQAMRQLGTAGEQIRVVFRGTDPAHVQPLAERAGVAAQVEVLPPIPYRQSLEFQRRSDVLLLMQWNDPREQGSCPGKLFEYLGALRPVLVLGLENGVPATIVRERAAGICANDPPAIAAQLKFWLEQKQRLGRIPALPIAAREGLSRTIQFEKLETFLAELINKR